VFYFRGYDFLIEIDGIIGVVMADLFTPEYKRLKARRPPPDLSTVIDFTSDLHKGESLTKYNGCVSKLDLSRSKTTLVGLKPSDCWEVFTFRDYPGFFFIVNPFQNGYQRYWASRCIKDFPQDVDNVTNLSALGGERGADLWSPFANKLSCDLHKDDPLRKLRWTTLGYHYNWSAQEYHEYKRGGFPKDVAHLSQHLALSLGFHNFSPEAAIVNYYYQDTNMGPHTDRSELDHTAPLISFSFGQPAVFMLGGTTKESAPMSLLIRSGDVCVMSGAARLLYHAVPRILPPDPDGKLTACFSTRKDSDSTTTTAFDPVTYKPDHDESECEKNDEIKTLNANIESVISSLDFSPFEAYLKSSRINMNIRQVLPAGCKSFDDLKSESECETLRYETNDENTKNNENCESPNMEQFLKHL